MAAIVLGACHRGIGESPSPMAKSFRDRIAASLDHPIDTAYSCRPPALLWTGALNAGLGAGLGSALGGSPLWAGIGGGAGVVIGYVLLWISLRVSGSGFSLGMALALAEDRLELHRLNLIGTRAVRLIRAIPYSEIRDVEDKDRLLEIRLRVVTDGEPLVVHTSKHGIGAGDEFADTLRRRIAAQSPAR
jgi:hypothetical protein